MGGLSIRYLYNIEPLYKLYSILKNILPALGLSLALLGGCVERKVELDVTGYSKKVSATVANIKEVTRVFLQERKPIGYKFCSEVITPINYSRGKVSQLYIQYTCVRDEEGRQYRFYGKDPTVCPRGEDLGDGKVLYGCNNEYFITGKNSSGVEEEVEVPEEIFLKLMEELRSGRKHCIFIQKYGKIKKLSFCE